MHLQVSEPQCYTVSFCLISAFSTVSSCHLFRDQLHLSQTWIHSIEELTSHLYPMEHYLFLKVLSSPVSVDCMTMLSYSSIQGPNMLQICFKIAFKRRRAVCSHTDSDIRRTWQTLSSTYLQTGSLSKHQPLCCYKHKDDTKTCSQSPSYISLY